MMSYPKSLPAQLTNGDSYNYQVFTHRACWDIDTELGAEDATVRMTGSPAVGDPVTACIQLGFECVSSNVQLIKKNQTNNTSFTVSYEAYEDDRGERCSFDDGDDNRSTSSQTRSAKGFAPCFWTIGDFNSVLAKRNEFKSVWRYAKGDGSAASDPLDFGVIAAGPGNSFGVKTDINSNRSAPASAAAEMGYSNSWSGGEFQDANDVYYTFEIAHSMEAIISTIPSNFNTYLHLIDFATGDVIESNDDAGGTTASAIQRNLCSGKYGLVVEGFGVNTGDFELRVSVKEIQVSAGRIEIDGSSTQCETRQLDRIKSVALGSSPIPGQSPTYSWEINTSDPNDPAAWGPATGAGTNHDLENPGRMGDTDIWFRRKATDCGSIAFSNFVKYTNQPFNGRAGQLRLSSSNPIPAGSDAGSVLSTQPATAGHASSIIWQQRTVEQGVAGAWSPITGATGQTLTIGNLGVTTDFQRIIISDCTDEEEESNIVQKVVIPVDGVIEGTILSTLGTPIGSVRVVATLQNTVLGSPQNTYESTTGSDGKYRISNIYYGAGEAIFQVVPSREDHEFINVSSPQNSTASVTLASPATGDPRNIASGVDFTDVTSLTIEGQITQGFDGISCNMEGVTVDLILDGVVNTVQTDSEGKYSLSVDNGIGQYGIKPSFQGHEFNPPQITRLVDDNLTGINFEDVQMRTLSGSVKAGCETPMGRATLKISALAGCGIMTTVTTAADGTYSIELPARSYTIDYQMIEDVVEGFDPLDIDLFLSAITTVDLTDESQTLDLVYHRQPVIEVTGLPEGPACGYEFSVLQQGITYPLVIKAYEGVVGGCPVDTGFLEIIDQISGIPASTQEFRLEDPDSDHIDYQILAGEPRQTAPHLNPITITLNAVYPEKTLTAEDFQVQALITGAIPQGTGILTVSPELPLFILRDPPGDNSFSFLSESTVLETATSFYSQEGAGANAWLNVRLGTEFTTGLGFSTETEIWADLKTSFTASEQTLNAEESIVSLTTSRSFSTAGDPDIIGGKGDLIIAAAMNMIYASTVEVLFNEQTCAPFTKNDWMIDNQGYSTGFIYSTKHIRDVVIKNLGTARDQSTNPKEKERFDNQISVWEQVLAYNDQLKDDAEFVRNLTLDGSAGEVEYSETMSSSKTLTVEFTQEINEEVAIEAGLNIAGTGLSGGALINMRMESGESKSETNLTELVTGFVLDDDDIGDDFSIDVKRDPVYKTPVFELIGGQTSCPYEEGTRAREGIELLADDPIQVGIDPNDAAEFFLQISNTSATSEDGSFILKAPGFATNPFGAEITIGGQAPPFTIEDLGFGQTATVLIKIRQGASSIFTYSGLTFEVESECDPDINAAVDLSAYFTSPCSNITLSTPSQGWLVNQSNDNKLSVSMTDYDLTKLNQVIVEYARAGTNGWTVGQVLESDGPELNASPLGTTVEIDLGGIVDGVYDVRLKLVCASGTVFSERVRGLIDRKAPAVFGLPRPIDDTFEEGDEIFVVFDETLDCSSFNASNVTISSEVGIVDIDLSASCSGNEILITPMDDPDNDADGILDHPGLPFVVTINNIQDVYGNTRSEPVSWTFSAGGDQETADADADGIPDNLDICPGFNDNLDADNDGIPDGCDLCPTVANAGLSFDGSNDYVNVPIGDFNTQEGTLEFWFKTPNSEVTQIPLYIGNEPTENGFTSANSTFEFHAAISNGRALVIFQNGDQGEAIRLRSLSTLLPNQWNHLAVTYDVDSEIRLFLNGRLEDDDFMADYFFANLSPTFIRMGRPGASTNQFQGTLDEVRIWDISRTEMDINSSYETEALANADGLITYFTFNSGIPNGDNTGSAVVTDQTDHNNDGSLQNFARNGISSNWVFGGPVRHLDSNDNGIGDACEIPEVRPLAEQTGISREVEQTAIVSFETPRITRLFPVPAKDRVFLNYVLPHGDRVSIQVFDLRGQRLIQQDMDGIRGRNQVTLAVESLPAGTYFIRLAQSSGRYVTQKLIIQ